MRWLGRLKPSRSRKPKRYTRTTVHLETEPFERLRDILFRRRQSFSDWLRRAIEKELHNEGE